MRRRERRDQSNDNREHMSMMLELLGLGPFEQRAVASLTAIGLHFSRLRFRMRAGLIPAAVVISLVAYTATAIALAVRKVRVSGG